MSMHKEKLEFEGDNLEVEYEYEPATGDGWNEPAYPEAIHVYSITKNGEEVNYSGHDIGLIMKRLTSHLCDYDPEPEDNPGPYRRNRGSYYSSDSYCGF